MLVALEAGADDIRGSGDSYEVVTDPSQMTSIRDILEAAGIEVESADVTQLPTNTVPLQVDVAGKVLRLIDALEDLDDVQTVYANFDVSDEVMEQLAG